MLRSRTAYGFALILLAATALAILAGGLLDRQHREVRALVLDYLAAVERRELEVALEYLVPEQRGRWRDFVDNKLGNRFVIEAVSVRAPSLLDRWLHGRPAVANQATVFIHVNAGTPEAWRATTVIPLDRRDGRWYLVNPPLRPAGEQ